MFYDAFAFAGQAFSCSLEPDNPYEVNCVALMLPGYKMFGHLAREAAQFLAPLLRAGFQAHG